MKHCGNRPDLHQAPGSAGDDILSIRRVEALAMHPRGVLMADPGAVNLVDFRGVVLLKYKS